MIVVDDDVVYVDVDDDVDVDYDDDTDTLKEPKCGP